MVSFHLFFLRYKSLFFSPFISIILYEYDLTCAKMLKCHVTLKFAIMTATGIILKNHYQFVTVVCYDFFPRKFYKKV